MRGLQLELLAQEGVKPGRVERQLRKCSSPGLRKKPMDEGLVAGLFGAQTCLNGRAAPRLHAG
jgi:hypothetical protein